MPAGIDAGRDRGARSRARRGARRAGGGPLRDGRGRRRIRFCGAQGRDLHVTLPVAVHEAALGARVDVPTLEGTGAAAHSARARPPVSGCGSAVRASGPARAAREDGAGDLVVEVQIVLPRELDETSRSLAAGVRPAAMATTSVGRLFEQA